MVPKKFSFQVSSLIFVFLFVTLTACGAPIQDEQECGNNRVEGNEVCDGTDLNGKVCENIVPNTQGSLKCNLTCKGFDVSACQARVSNQPEEPTTCNNNNTKENNEECDGSDLGGATCASLNLGTGTLTCQNCKLVKTACVTQPDSPNKPAVCGNNKKEKNEVCDGTALDNQTCQSILGSDYEGTLACNAICNGFDTTHCTKRKTCGDGIKNKSDEECDGNDFGGATCGTGKMGTLKCTDTCKIDASACIAAPTDPANQEFEWFGQNVSNAEWGNFTEDAGLQRIRTELNAMKKDRKEEKKIQLKVNGAIVTSVYDYDRGQYAYLQDKNTAIFVRFSKKVSQKVKVGDKISFTTYKLYNYGLKHMVYVRKHANLTIVGNNQKIFAINANTDTTIPTTDATNNDNIYKFVTFQAKVTTKGNCNINVDQYNNSGICYTIESYLDPAKVMNLSARVPLGSNEPNVDDYVMFAGPLRKLNGKDIFIIDENQENLFIKFP